MPEHVYHSNCSYPITTKGHAPLQGRVPAFSLPDHAFLCIQGSTRIHTTEIFVKVSRNALSNVHWTGTMIPCVPRIHKSPNKETLNGHSEFHPLGL